jgi:hypothetical protein
MLPSPSQGTRVAPRPAFQPRCGSATAPSGWRGFLCDRTLPFLKLTQKQPLQPLKVCLDHPSLLPLPCPVPSEDPCTLQVTGQAFRGNLCRQGATRCTVPPAHHLDLCRSEGSPAALPQVGPRPTPQTRTVGTQLFYNSSITVQSRFIDSIEYQCHSIRGCL